MKQTRRFFAVTSLLALAACASGSTPQETADKRAQIDQEATVALNQLYTENPEAKTLSERAKGILIMPDIIKGGLGITGEGGTGVLRVNGQPAGYYNLTSAGFGLAIGVQSYSQVLMFLEDQALADFQAGQGWEAGVDGSVAVLDTGASGEVDTSNIQAPIVGFVFGETGLMANASIEGSKYTRLDD
ncbi:MAG: hypothetical protein H6851_17000 [Geminicoccaceae bacterium]|nr:hypothetical protein [Geminicoccaceae bacterium]MCB9945308.1 hypothetical protein [Geminicoccaceae bacterium]